MLLAVQMLAVHYTAMLFLRRIYDNHRTASEIDAAVFRATRLMHLFREQLSAMAKLKGKSGEQKVTVEHVHVYKGGQAIVGTVENEKGRKK